MKTINEILVIVKERFEENVKTTVSRGLCYAAYRARFADRLSREEEIKFTKYLKKAKEVKRDFIAFVAKLQMKETSSIGLLKILILE